MVTHTGTQTIPLLRIPRQGAMTALMTILHRQKDIAVGMAAMITIEDRTMITTGGTITIIGLNQNRNLFTCHPLRLLLLLLKQSSDQVAPQEQLLMESTVSFLKINAAREAKAPLTPALMECGYPATVV